MENDRDEQRSRITGYSKIMIEDRIPTKYNITQYKKQLINCDTPEKVRLNSIIDFVDTVLSDYKYKIIKIIMDMKCDERKVCYYGDEEARTYFDKALVNAVIEEIIKKI